MTTLQALDLSNGPLLAEMLTKGAERLHTEPEAPARNPEDLVTHIFRSALTRNPSPEELTLGVELAGTPATQEGIARSLDAACLSRATPAPFFVSFSGPTP